MTREEQMTEATEANTAPESKMVVGWTDKTKARVVKFMEADPENIVGAIKLLRLRSGLDLQISKRLIGEWMDDHLLRYYPLSFERKC